MTEELIPNIPRLAGRVLNNMYRKSLTKGEPDLNILFISNMPFRAIAKMTNGHFFRGLGGFLSFLLAYVCAQCVNYVVQRKPVFGATVEIRKTIGWYILTVTVAGVVSVALPGYLVPVLARYVGGAAATIANVVNIVLQVAINYPMLKFVIMKK